MSPEADDVCNCAHVREHHGPTVDRLTPCRECSCENYERMPDGARIREEIDRVEGELRTSYIRKLREAGYPDQPIHKEIGLLILTIAEFLALEKE